MTTNIFPQMFLFKFQVNALTPNSHTLRYMLQPLLGAQTYDLSDMFFMAKIKVSTKKDAPLPDNTEASTINDCLFSAIKTMKLYVNEQVFLNVLLLQVIETTFLSFQQTLGFHAVLWLPAIFFKKAGSRLYRC